MKNTVYYKNRLILFYYNRNKNFVLSFYTLYAISKLYIHTYYGFRFFWKFPSEQFELSLKSFFWENSLFKLLTLRWNVKNIVENKKKYIFKTER